MSYIVYEGLSTPNEVLSKMADYIERRGYTIVSPLADDANIYDRSTVDGKKIVFQDKTNEYFVSLRSANGTNIFGTNDDAQMDVTSADKDVHYYGIGMTVSEGYSKAQRWYNQYNAPIQYRGKDVQGVFMPVSQGTTIAVQTRPTKVDYPTPVDEPVKDDYPDAPVKDDYPTKPTEPQDPTKQGSTGGENAPSDKKIAPRITTINGTNPFTLQQFDTSYNYDGVPLPDLFYDTAHQFNSEIVLLLDNNSMRIMNGTSGHGNGVKNNGIYVYGTGQYKDQTLCFGEDISTMTEQHFMDKWNAMSDAQKKKFSVGSNYSFPFIVADGKNNGDVNADAIVASIGPARPGFFDEIVGIAMPKSAFEKLKNFSQTITDYNNDLAQYKKDLATYNSQVAAIDAKYDKELKDYQDACDAIDKDYDNKVSDYNEYLKKLKDYSDYLEKEDSYMEYLINKNAKGFTYNLYCNEVTKPTDTLAFSLVKQGQKVVDKVTDPPKRPTAPVKPVKAQYPNKPVKPPINHAAFAACYYIFNSLSEIQKEANDFRDLIHSTNDKVSTGFTNIISIYRPIKDSLGFLTSLCNTYSTKYSTKYVPVYEQGDIRNDELFPTPSDIMYDNVNDNLTYPNKSVKSYELTSASSITSKEITQSFVSPYYTSSLTWNKDYKIVRIDGNFTVEATMSDGTTQIVPNSSGALSHTYSIYLMPEDVIKSNYSAAKADKYGFSIMEEYNNQTSPEWVQYKADCAKIDNDYKTAMTQYNKDLTQYQADMKTYDTAYDAYIKDLENGIGITYKDDETALLYQTTHLIFGNLDKYDTWTGGAYFSGSATRYMMKTAYKVYEDKDESDEAILPVLSSGEYSNTFLRIDIDDAPTDARGNIYWASSGNDNITGKRLSLPIRVKGQAQNGKIPHYLYLQSQERLDWGRDINTLNCITINMPIYFSVCVDPDAMDLYASAGAANGIYFISTLNMQTSHTYEIQYPDSNILCEIFPMGKRRGYYGFDGISIYQEVDEASSEDTGKTETDESSTDKT